MSTVERWLEFDKDTRRKKFINQCLGLLLVLMVMLVSSHFRPQQHPLTLLAVAGLMIAILVQPVRTTSSPSWRACSVLYMLLLALALRAEFHYMGGAGILWLLPCAGGMVLVSSLFMTRGLDYGAAVAGIWLVFLALPSTLPEQTGLSFILIYVLAVTGFGTLMNRSYIVGSLRLMKARDDFRLLAETDALTGLENRRRFIARLDEVVAEGRPSLLLLLLDADHFKRINDRWGHSVGDQALVRIAEAIRPGDEIMASARLGGEEFAVLLDSAEAKDQATVLRGFADRLARSTLPVSLSVGAVWMPGETSSASALVAADMQLYAAKEAGRHRIFFQGQMICETLAAQALAG